MTTRIKAWSYSRLSVFEQCKRRAKLAYIDRIPEPERPLPAGKTEHANDRGTRVHDAAERFVKGGIELIPELEKFREEFIKLRELYSKGLVSLEGDWAVDQDWSPVAWKSQDTWLRLKLDALYMYDKGRKGVVIDYKTGKLYGNEIKHAEQGQLYQLAAFMRYPDLEELTVEFWYTDLDEIRTTVYTRAQGLRFLKGFSDRGANFTTTENFPPSPSRFACKWCPYNGTHCDVGV